jgi:hypothetical protein
VAVDIVIYHNPVCGTSRNTLGLIRNAGIEPHVVEYLKTPPSRALLVELIDRAGITPRGRGQYAAGLHDHGRRAVRRRDRSAGRGRLFRRLRLLRA